MIFIMGAYSINQYQFTFDDSRICLCMGMDRFDGELVIVDVVWMAKKEGIVTRHSYHCTILKDLKIWAIDK
jgi:hypothetical protein